MLRGLGVEQALMLTGDNDRAARAIARQAGISDVRSGLLPAMKLDAIEELEARPWCGCDGRRWCQ